jgi:hypothetical protein
VDVQSLMFLVMVLLMWAVVLRSLGPVKRARDLLRDLLLVVAFWAVVAALYSGLLAIFGE